MRKWLMLGGVAMLCAWLPFVYAELTSSPKQQKARVLPDDRAEDDGTSVKAAAEGDDESAKKAEPEPVAKENVAEPSAKPQPVAAAEPEARAMQKPELPTPTPTPTDEAEATEPENETQTDTPAPPPIASGPTAELKIAFDKQARDPLWAADTEKQLRGLFRGGDLPAELLQAASCRSAVCRMELRWTRERAPSYVSLYESVRRDFASSVGVEPVGTLDEQGQQLVNLYLARKGYTVADLTK